MNQYSKYKHKLIFVVYHIFCDFTIIIGREWNILVLYLFDAFTIPLIFHFKDVLLQSQLNIFLVSMKLSYLCLTT